MFLTLDETTKRIKENKLLHIAADESLLVKLPKGNWIGGTTPYFITENGGITSKDRLFVNEFDFAGEWKIVVYDKDSLLRIPEGSYRNGLNFVIIPFASEAAVVYAKETPNSNELLMTPTLGWITGFDLSANASAKVFDGASLKSYESEAVVLHMGLPDNRMASIGITNIFRASDNSPALDFGEDTLTVKSFRVDGKEMIFSDYLTENKINTELPLVADYNGTLVNVSIKSVSQEKKTVELYAPVFAGKTYRFAEPVEDYAAVFKRELGSIGRVNPVFSCNCILNYLYGKLEGKATPPFSGPITFGEIAYQLLNQTLVYVQIV